MRTRIPNTSARTVPGSDKSHRLPTFNEARSNRRRTIVNTKLRRAVISAACAKIENDTIKRIAIKTRTILVLCFVRPYYIFVNIIHSA